LKKRLLTTAVHEIANFEVSLRLRFVRIFIFSGKYKVPKLATDKKRRKVVRQFAITKKKTENDYA